MSLPEFPPAMRPRIRIDTDFLMRQTSALARVKWKRRTWNECGEMLFRHFEKTSPVGRRTASLADPTSTSEASTYWRMAKELVHAVVASRDPRYEAIRKRLGNLREPSTPRLWSTLGLWLAGVLGISTSVTGPLVAVMLYGVAEAGGDWEVLRDLRKS